MRLWIAPVLLAVGLLFLTGLRLWFFPGWLPDFVAQVRPSRLSSRFFTAGCVMRKPTPTVWVPHNCCLLCEHRYPRAAKDVGGAAQAVGCGFVPFPGSVVDVVLPGRQMASRTL